MVSFGVEPDRVTLYQLVKQNNHFLSLRGRRRKVKGSLGEFARIPRTSPPCFRRLPRRLPFLPQRQLYVHYHSSSTRICFSCLTKHATWRLPLQQFRKTTDQPSNLVHHQIQDLLANGVVPTSIVVGGVLLARDHLFRMVQVTVYSCTSLVCTQIKQHQLTQNVSHATSSHKVIPLK